MTPGAFVAVGFWLAGMGWLVWAAHTAPVEPVDWLEPIDWFEPVDGWLIGISPASVSDLDESVADDFALDLEQLRGIRSFNLADWQ